MRRRTLCLSLLICTIALSCRNQQQNAAEAARLPATHDLSIDEARGGHTLARHVARTDDQLKQRLQQERNISAASTYTDRQTAERAVGRSLRESDARIRQWFGRGERRPNLVLDFSDPTNSLGRVLYRGAMGSVPCDHAIVVLKAAGAQDYFVLTSYPECRP
jgi:hypothetical protein